MESLLYGFVMYVISLVVSEMVYSIHNGIVDSSLLSSSFVSPLFFSLVCTNYPNKQEMFLHFQ